MVRHWSENTSDGELVNVDTAGLLEMLLKNMDVSEVPKGMETFKIFSELKETFDRSRLSDELVFTDASYIFLKNIVERSIPSSLGMNPDVVVAIGDFINAK